MLSIRVLVCVLRSFSFVVLNRIGIALFRTAVSFNYDQSCVCDENADMKDIQEAVYIKSLLSFRLSILAHVSSGRPPPHPTFPDDPHGSYSRVLV